MKLRALLCALALGACGQSQGPQTPAAPAGPDPSVMHIEIGRYSLMLAQVHDLSAGRPGAAEIAPTEPRALARRLREVVWAYNLERSRLCGRGLFTDVACGPAFEPVWINEPGDAAPTLDVLAERQTAVDALVIPFWSAVCADARARQVHVEGGVCVME